MLGESEQGGAYKFLFEGSANLILIEVYSMVPSDLYVG